MGLVYQNRRAGPEVRRGAMLVVVAFVLVVLIIFASITINTNWMLLAKSEAQTATDMSAQAALQHYVFNTQASSPSKRRRQAQEKGRQVFESNPIGGQSNPLSRDSIILGNVIGGEFYPGSSAPGLKASSNIRSAVKVEVEIGRSKGSKAVPLFLNNFIGISEFSPSGLAVVSIPPVDLVLCLDVSRSMTLRAQGGRPPGAQFFDPPVEGSRLFALDRVVRKFATNFADSNIRLRMGLVTLGGGRPNSPRLDGDPVRQRKFAVIESKLQETLNNVDQIIRPLSKYKRQPLLTSSPKLVPG